MTVQVPTDVTVQAPTDGTVQAPTDVTVEAPADGTVQYCITYVKFLSLRTKNLIPLACIEEGKIYF